MRSMVVRAASVLFVIMAGALSESQAAEGASVFDIPQLAGITVDGKVDDWGDAGLRVEIMGDKNGRVLPAENLEARCRLGWDTRGLLVLLHVQDDKAVETDDDQNLWKQDCVEFFLADRQGGQNMVQCFVAPGCDPRHPEPRHRSDDYRRSAGLRQTPVTFSVARAKTANGYVLEALIPWANVGVEPKVGEEAGFTLSVDDVDNPAEDSLTGGQINVVWYPAVGTYKDTSLMYRIRLAERPSPPDALRMHARIEWPAKWTVEICALSDRSGAPVELMRDGKSIASSALHRSGRYALAAISLPVPPSAKVSRDVDVYLDGKRAGMITLPAAPSDSLVLRAFDGASAGVVEAASIHPRLDPSPKGEADVLVITTDIAMERSVSKWQTVNVEATTVGGKVVAHQEAKRGEVVRLNTARWPDGPYEIRMTRVASDGLLDISHLLWWKGDWSPLIAALMDECDKLPAQSDDRTALLCRLLGEVVRDLFGGDPRDPATAKAGPAPGSDKWAGIHYALMEYRELKMGDRASIRPYGFHPFAWIDPVDGTPQFARAYLPPGYDPAKKWPMVVLLHGYSPPNPPYIRWGCAQRHSALSIADRYGVIVLEPHGRGNSSYSGIGELDVLRAMQMVTQKLSVDDDRVYLIGYSMGGRGAVYLGSRHPELFAAIAPMAGTGSDYRERMDEERIAALTPRQLFLREAGSNFSQAEALLSTPAFVSVGDADDYDMDTDARFLAKTLQRWGYDVRYLEVPGKTHIMPLGSEDEAFRWLLQHRREQNPQHVRVRAPDLKSAHAHWVTVEQIENWPAFAHVDAQVIDPHTIRLNTDNVLQVTLSPGAVLVSRRDPVRVVWNGNETGPHSFAGGSVTLCAEGYAPAEGRKTPQIGGPMQDVTTTPFAIVVGTLSKDPRMRAFCRLRAEDVRGGWEDWQHVEPRYFLDTEITDEQIRQYSLILYGGPSDNLVTQKLADRLPLKIEAETITIAGQSFKATDAALGMICPHPLNPDRYVVVKAGNSADGMFMVDRLPDELDFAIVDARIHTDDLAASPESIAIVSGFFDHEWRYREQGVVRGDATARAKAVVRKAPKYLTAKVDSPQLMVSDLLCTQATHTFREMRRDLNWRWRPIKLDGRAYEHGIGVHIANSQVSTVTYNLEGGDWKRLKATIGLEIERPQELSERSKKGIAVWCEVLGDGKPLYRSPVFRWDSKPVDVDVPVEGVRVLELRVANDDWWAPDVDSVDWADVRLEK